MEQPLLQVEALSRHFGGVQAVSELSFSLARGEILAIIGPNGAGKTTVFNCLSGVTRADKGRVIFKSVDISPAPAARIARLGMARTFQNFELFEGLSTLENLLSGFHAHLKTGLWQALNMWHQKSFAAREEKQVREAAFEIMELLGLQEVAHVAVQDLPYGTRRQVEIGRALACRPDLLLLDEPAAGMSLEECQLLSRRIRKIRDQLGLGILMIEHNLRLVMNLSDRLLALNSGREITSGKPAEVMAHPQVIQAWMGH